MEYTAPERLGIFPIPETVTGMSKKLTPDMRVIDAVAAYINAKDSVPPENATELGMILWEVDQHMKSPEVRAKLHEQISADLEAIMAGKNPLADLVQPTIPVSENGIVNRLKKIISCDA
jgi:hypothetical protein